MKFVGLTTTPASGQEERMFNARPFPCPACHEFINETMKTCRFCSAPVDAQAAAAAITSQERINKACNDASLIRNLAGVMWLCFVLRFVPFIGLVAGIALLILFLVIPVRLVIWLVRFGGIKTEDVDYKSAKRNVLMALVLWVLMLLVPVVLIFLMAGAMTLAG
jgi:hypothetical protein